MKQLCTRRPPADEVLAALGLDVVHVQLARGPRCARSRAAWSRETRSPAARATPRARRCLRSSMNGSSAANRSRSGSGTDRQRPCALSVGPHVVLAAHASEDAEPAEQRLQPAHVRLADHVETDDSGALANRHVPLGLEDAAQVRRDDRQRRREQLRRAPSIVRATSEQVPPLDERTQDLAVQTDPSTDECRDPATRSARTCRCTPGNTDSTCVEHPLVLRRRSPSGTRSSATGSCRASYWPTNPSPCSQPASAASAISS